MRARFTSTCIAAALICTPAVAILASDDPIHGVDVIVRKKLGGVVMQTTTDKEGRFVFENVPTGQYVLSVNQRTMRSTARISSSKGKIRTGEIVDEVQQAEVLVELATGALSTPVTITAPKGRITGSVNHLLASGVDGGEVTVPAVPKPPRKERKR